MVITRPESAGAKDLPAGAKLAAVDHKDVPGLAATFGSHGVEVVISTVGEDAIANQKAFADAAKQAGVKLFLPSEFGIPSEGHKEEPWTAKGEVVG